MNWRRGADIPVVLLVGLIAGELGSGKSMAIRALGAGIDAGRHRILYVSQSGLTPRRLYQALPGHARGDPLPHRLRAFEAISQRVAPPPKACS